MPSFIRQSDLAYVEASSEPQTKGDIHIQCAEIVDPSYILNDNWQDDPMNPSVCWRPKTLTELDQEKTARATKLDQPRLAFESVIEQLWDNSAELQAAFPDPGGYGKMKQDAILRYKAKINGS